MTRRALVRGLERQPLSGRGLGVAVLAAASLRVYGYGSLDLVAFTAGVGGLGLLALCALATAAAAWRLRRRTLPEARGPLRIEAGVPVATGFALPTLDRLPLLTLDWTWVAPGAVEVRLAREDGLAREVVVARRRCRVGCRRRRFRVSDAFGLCRLAWERDEALPLTVLPAPGALRRLGALHARAGADGLSHPLGTPEGDRMDIRRYAPGDTVRDILWKAFARTRQLNVRTRERSLERTRRTAAYLVSAPGDEAAAAAARVALETGALGHAWLFGADGSQGALEELEPALEAVAASGSFAGPPGLETFLSGIEAAGAESCVVFAPAAPGEWLERALEAARRRPGRLSFVLGAEGVVQPGPALPAWQRLLFVAQDPTGPSPGALRALLARLEAAGCAAQIVDRSTGRHFASALPGFAPGLAAAAGAAG